MAFQAAPPLREFGVDIYVVNLVSLAMLRELGPIMTAIVLAGRSGSAFAAEIGTMKVNEEIDALTTMGLDPVRFLVAPRVLAGILVTPVLTIYADLVGVGGGLLVMFGRGYPLVLLWRQLGRCRYQRCDCRAHQGVCLWRPRCGHRMFARPADQIGSQRRRHLHHAFGGHQHLPYRCGGRDFRRCLLCHRFLMDQDAIISVRGLTAAYGDDVILREISFM